MIAPSRTITAPIGTSFLFPASRARSTALRMYCSSAPRPPPRVPTFPSLSTGKRRRGCLPEGQLALRIAVDDDVVSLVELAFENGEGEGVLQETLDRALQRSGAERRVVALCRQDFTCRRSELEGELPVGEQILEPVQLQVDDVLDLLLAEWLEDDDVVDAVEEFRTEMLTQRTRNLRFDHRSILSRMLEDVSATDVRCHDDDGVAEIDSPAL